MKKIVNIHCGTCFKRKPKNTTDLYFSYRGITCVQEEWTKFVSKFERWMLNKKNWGNCPFECSSSGDYSDSIVLEFDDGSFENYDQYSLDEVVEKLISKEYIFTK